MFFNKYKDILTENGKTKLNPITALIGGMLAGCFSVLGNNPFDVVKTQMQGKDAKLYKNTVDCFFTILRSEGITGLYKGTVPRMGRVVPGQVICRPGSSIGNVNSFEELIACIIGRHLHEL